MVLCQGSFSDIVRMDIVLEVIVFMTEDIHVEVFVFSLTAPTYLRPAILSRWTFVSGTCFNSFSFPTVVVDPSDCVVRTTQ